MISSTFKKEKNANIERRFSCPLSFANSVRFISLFVIIGLWECFGQLGFIEPSTFSYPSAIVFSFFELVMNGQMGNAAIESSGILFAGLGIAIPSGILIGILMGRYKIFEYALDTYVFAL